jgi:hypothetical protein
VASFSGASVYTDAEDETVDVTAYHPLVANGSGGGEPVTPKRFLNVGGVAVPIQ